MEIDSILVRAYGRADVQRLRRAGGDLWQLEGRIGPHGGGVFYSGALVRLSARTALRMGLIGMGEECSAIADPPEEGVIRATGRSARVRAKRVAQPDTQPA
jgi:hypothetical protein